MIPGLVGGGIVTASLGAGFGALYLLRYLYGQRGKPGAVLFMGNIASVAVFCFVYGGALFVSDPTLRVALEAVTIVGVAFMGPFFLAFGLDYTGRGDLVRTPLFAPVFAVPLLTIGLVATNSVHHLVWTGVESNPVFGLETITYTLQPWGVFAALFSIGTAAIGSLLLIGAILSYGPLYRREATAVILSTVPPTVGVLLWVFEVGPLPQLHLTASLMLIHVSLDTYAFIGTHMFDTNPATQRVAEQTGLDTLSDPVLVVDEQQRIVRTNGRAADLFLQGDQTKLPVFLETALGTDLQTLRDVGELRTDRATGQMFGVSYTPLTDPKGNTVGGMLVLYDITQERQREQRLAVLNRVLRHNLRNETSVIRGYAELLGTRLDNEEQSKQAEQIVTASNRLLSIAEKSREFENAQQQERKSESVQVSKVLADIEKDCAARHTEATIEWTVRPSELEINTDPTLFSLILTNLVENAILHSGDGEQTVEISAAIASDSSGTVRFEFTDSNERIPEMEIDSLREGYETSLQHGQGIGLWIVYWCVTELQGDIEFRYDDGNVITVRL